MAETLALFSVYVPEWGAKEDANMVLLRIFSNMADSISRRLYRVPDKNFKAFLNMLGTNLLPAETSRVPVTFVLAEGAIEEVNIPTKTKVEAPENEKHPAVIFETEKSMIASCTKLKGLYSVNPKEDLVFNHKSELEEGEISELFFSSPSQEHAIYLGHDYLFNLRGKDEEDYSLLSLEIAGANETFNSKNIIWEYWGESINRKEDWLPFEIKISDKKDIWTLKKTNPGSTKKKEIQGYKTFWIRARVKGKLLKDLPKVESINLAGVSFDDSPLHVNKDGFMFIPYYLQNLTLVKPDKMFYNDNSIVAENPFYPFGRKPKTHDIFYIGCQEAFSKKHAMIIIVTSNVEPGDPNNSKLEDLKIVWEYWNGSQWYRLEEYDIHSSFLHTKKLTPFWFICPQDIEPNEVNGIKDYWIRGRIDTGNYGIQDYENNGTPQDYEKCFIPPEIGDLKIHYFYDKSQFFSHCLVKDNLQFIECIDSRDIKLFQPLEEEFQSIYFGFDKPFPNGRVSIYFSLIDQEYLDQSIPRIDWKYSRKKGGKVEYTSLKVSDTTNNLTENSTLEFIGPIDITNEKKFGQELYWIRADVVRGQFESFSRSMLSFINRNVDAISTGAFKLNINLLKLVLRNLYLPNIINKKQPNDPSNSQSTIQEIESFPIFSVSPCLSKDFMHTRFSIPKEVLDVPAAPKIKGVHMNTTWAIQAETFIDEILGTSDGTAAQSFFFIKTPVFFENIWVNEQYASYEESIENIETTETGDKWVKWNCVDDFFESNEKDRHYVINGESGQLRFGDGMNGMIPPVGGVIKAAYQTGGGLEGNVAIGEVKNLIASIPFIDEVRNPDAAEGGANSEVIEKALEKAPKRIKHRYRAVTAEDYEWLAKEASRAVVKSKCISNFNDQGIKQQGCVLVIIVPEGKEERPQPSSELLRIVKKYLLERCPIPASKLTISTPMYFKVSISAILIVKSMDVASRVKLLAQEGLENFLHPLFGGSGGKGWDFGRLPCLSDISSFLSRISGVDHIEQLSMRIRELNNGEFYDISDLQDNVILPFYALCSSDIHQINIKWVG